MKPIVSQNSTGPLLEVCVDTTQGVIAARDGGADRIELCSALSEGGLTPSAGLVRFAAQHAEIPCYAMIRPRSGHFRYSHDDLSIMLRDIDFVGRTGLAGVVMGASGQNGDLDVAALTELMNAAQGLGTTMHRVIDIVADPLLAVEQAIDLGFERILTSGGSRTAPEGRDAISKMVFRAKEAISIMPGAGVSPENVSELVETTGVREVHASCRVKTSDAPSGNWTRDFEFETLTSEETVRSLKTNLVTGRSPL